MIPMGGGVRLPTVIVTPKNAAAPLPILMERTPYGTEGFAASVPRRAKRLGLDGYIHVEQDIRGRFGSEGAFDMNRPPHSGHAGTDESSDTYDTIDWLVKNVPNNNGRVGIFGISYPGWLTAVAGIGAHPALKAISPQAPMGDAWMGDDFFHQGAFRASYGLEYSWMMEASSDLSVTPSPARYDTYEWYLSFPTLGALAQAVGADRWPTWRRFVEHPAYDSVWQAPAPPPFFPHTSLPPPSRGGACAGVRFGVEGGGRRKVPGGGGGRRRRKGGGWLRRGAPKGGGAPPPLPPRRRRPVVRPAEHGGGGRLVHLQPRAPRAVPAAAGGADLFAHIAVAPLGDRGPALRGPPTRPAQLADWGARAGRYASR